MARMQTIDNDLLTTITGGFARASANSSSSQMELALTKLASDIKDVARTPPPNNQMMPMMMMAMMSRR